MINALFMNDVRFQAAKDLSFKLFMKKSSSLSLYLASNCDDMLRNSMNSINNELINAKFD
jgi:hypothetical protein